VIIATEGEHMIDLQPLLDEHDIEIRSKADGPKDIWWHRLAFWVGRKFTDGFDTRFATALGRTVYLPKNIDPDSTRAYALLRHEVVHVLQWLKWGWWYNLSYALIFPMFVTMRAWWEFGGYTQNALLEHERWGDSPRWAIKRAKFVDWMVDVFCTKTYGWMLPSETLVRHLWNKRLDAIEQGDIEGFSYL
jgi:hypothetical protein